MDEMLCTNDDIEEEAFCRRHGPTTVIKSGTFSGYEGGVCSFWKLTCGCTLIDESDDIHSAE